MRLDEANIKTELRGLPARVRMVLRAGTKLPKGTLIVRTPEGRSFLVGGNAPGPDAEIRLKNWRLPSAHHHCSG